MPWWEIVLVSIAFPAIAFGLLCLFLYPFIALASGGIKALTTISGWDK
jgi:hypothetical protein